MEARWKVVTNDGTTVWGAMYRRENAEAEAAELNAHGLEEFKPYRVDVDTEEG